MVVDFKNKKNINRVGNKAKFLIEMLDNGFNVPNGFVIDSDTYLEEIKNNKLDKTINEILSNIKKDNIRQISEDIRALFDSFEFSISTKKEIEKRLDKEKLYAVRSSGIKEDLDNYSFAGQYETFLNVKNISIVKRIIDCYKSMFSETILTYLFNNNIGYDSLQMSVIVQEMVPSEYSGICFTVDPVTGNDKTMLIELGLGLGENIVSGQNKPEQYYYNWFDEKASFSKDNKFLNETQILKIGKEFSKIMRYFGYPCDIEFALANNELFILQARKITKIKYLGYRDLWSTADFKDGGVSASVCYPYMWSLYEYIWEYTLRKFILDSKILKPLELPTKLGDMFYGRCYWNLSAVKKAMSKIVGYKEREFDNEYGITPIYEGNGKTTGINPISIIAIIKMAIAQSKIVKTREKNADKLKNELLEKYYYYLGLYNTNSIKNIKEVWTKLTHDDYLKSESTYFWQIFINTVHQSLNKDSLLKYIEESDYLDLISNIDDISHLLPFYEMWDISRLIRVDSKENSFWMKSDVETLKKSLDEDTIINKQIKDLIKKYGYHSDKELDVAYPCYYEDITPIITNIRDLVLLDDSYSPKIDKEQGDKIYNKKLKNIKNKIGIGNYKDLETKIIKIRKMLWWREEFRDISTRFYYLIRIYTLQLAKELVSEQVLQEIDDIWFLKVANIWDYLSGKIDQEDIEVIINKNKKYYDSYRNYLSENEIGKVFSEEININSKKDLRGIGANNGVVSGTARVIESFDEIDRLQEGDILVTRFTDTGWTPKFAILKGIVTEYGGVLCHAAIVSREYGIPAIVSATNIMSEIKDGEFITIDGTTGKIRKGK